MRFLVLVALFFVSVPIFADQDFTPFKAKFALYYKWVHLGYSEYRLTALPDSHYRFDLISKMRVLLFSDRRQVSTVFTAKEERLIAIEYRHNRQGTGHDYDERVQFLPDQKVISASFRNSDKKVDYDQEVIDGLLVQFQLMLDVQRQRKPLTYKIFESFGVMNREFSYVGDDVANLDMGETPCTKVEVVRKQKDVKTQVCFAKSMNYLPILLEHYNKGKKQFVAKLVEYTPL